MDFVAIDFETANSRRTSACSLGVAVVESNRIVDTKEWLIKPYPYEFNPFNVQIHGITEEDTKEAPTFEEIWSDLFPLLNGNVVVAHNASFDVSVLRSAVEHYQLAAPNIDFICTYRLSQAMFPSASAYRLDFICKMLNISLDHHCASSDAKASAQILFRAMENKAVFDLTGIEKAYSLCRGFWIDDCYYSPCRIGSDDSVKLKSRNRSDIENVKCLDDDFVGKNFVFTGTLLSMPRSSAQKVVTVGGGVAQSGITKDTDYLVVGMTDYTKLAGNSESSKLRKAKAMRENGQKIVIIAEDEFLNMIDDELYQCCFNSKREDLPSTSYKCSFDDPNQDTDDIKTICNKLINSLADICEFENLPDNALCLKEIRKGVSVMFEASVLCRIIDEGFVRVAQFPSRFAEQIREKSKIRLESPENEQDITILISGKSDFERCCELVRIALGKCLDDYPKDFDCCNTLYIKDGGCCDAKRCICKNKDFAMGCGYKKKLRQGIYFIGKNRNA